MLFLVLVALIAVGYFSILLVPEAWPAVNPLIFLAYELSVLLTLGVLAFLGLVGIVGLGRARYSKRPVGRIHLRLIAISSIGFLVCFVFACVRAFVGYGLPPGSCLLAFDTAVWQDPASDEFVKGDITPRQKMLHDVVRNVILGRTRTEIETRLGPSLDTGFQSTSRDLIYITGPQRDSLFAIDSEWLLIWLDQDGRVARFKIASD